MSSHHIVKEDQEPALLIIEPAAATFGQIQEMLEWSPTVMVVDEQLEDVLLWGIKVDVVLVRADHEARIRESVIHQAPVKLITYDAHTDALTTAFFYLHAARYQSVNVVGGDLPRMQDLARHLDVVAFDQQIRWSYIKGGFFEKWVPAGHSLMIYPPTDGRRQLAAYDGPLCIRREHPFWVAEIIS